MLCLSIRRHLCFGIFHPGLGNYINAFLTCPIWSTACNHQNLRFAVCVLTPVPRRAHVARETRDASITSVISVTRVMISVTLCDVRWAGWRTPSAGTTRTPATAAGSPASTSPHRCWTRTSRSRSWPSSSTRSGPSRPARSTWAPSAPIPRSERCGRSTSGELVISWMYLDGNHVRFYSWGSSAGTGGCLGSARPIHHTRVASIDPYKAVHSTDSPVFELVSRQWKLWCSGELQWVWTLLSPVIS